MRYMTSQEIVNSLVENVLELESLEFPLGDPARHSVYLRKQRFRGDAWTAAQARGERFISPFHLDDHLVGFSASQLLNKVVFDVLNADPAICKQFGDCFTREGAWEYDFRLSPRTVEPGQTRTPVLFPRQPIQWNARCGHGVLEPDPGPGRR